MGCHVVMLAVGLLRETAWSPSVYLTTSLLSVISTLRQVATPDLRHSSRLCTCSVYTQLSRTVNTVHTVFYTAFYTVNTYVDCCVQMYAHYA